MLGRKNTLSTKNLDEEVEIKEFKGRKIIIRMLSQEDIRYPEKFQNYINSLIEDKDAQIVLKNRRSLDDEVNWIKDILKGMKESKTITLIAEHDDAVIGEATIVLCRERRSHVAELGISILDGYRGMGLGSYLLSQIISLAWNNLKPPPEIIRLSTLISNKEAINFYQRHGFDIVATIPNQIEFEDKFIDEVVMVLYREKDIGKKNY